MVADRHQRKGQVHRLGQRHVHAPQDLQRAGAFHARGLVQFFRHAQEGLAQQEDRKGRCEIWQADADQRVDQAQVRQRAVVLHQQDVGHDHQLHQHQRKQHVLAAEAEAGKGIGRQRAQHQLHRQDHHHQQCGVEEVARKRRGGPGVAEVVQRERRGEREARRILAGVEGRPDGVGQRRKPQQRQHPGGQGVEPGGLLVGGDAGRCHW